VVSDYLEVSSAPSEIEKRQQEKAKQQKAADEGRRAEKLANLKAVRKAEQVKFDEQSVCAHWDGFDSFF
jgi:hypothetical protein